MSTRRISERYAKALLDISMSTNSTSQVFTDIQDIQALLDSSYEFRKMLVSSIIPKHLKEKSFLNILAKYKCPKSKIVRPFFELVFRKNRERLIEEICTLFVESYYASQNTVVVNVTSANTLTSKTLPLVKDFVKKISQSKKQIIHTSTDASLIGGFLVEFEGKILDATLKNELKHIQQSI